MKQRFWPIVLGLLLSACSPSERYLKLELLSPTIVQLPYKERFNMHDIEVVIEPIVMRNDAVRISTYVEGFRTKQRQTWVQEGYGSVELEFDGGKSKYFIVFHEFHVEKTSVSSVTFSITCYWKSGPR